MISSSLLTSLKLFAIQFLKVCLKFYPKRQVVANWKQKLKVGVCTRGVATERNLEKRREREGGGRLVG